jgi:hypothetical protein
MRAAHVRRHFFEAKKITTKPGFADEALSQIQDLYKAKRELRQKLRSKTISAEQFTADRRAVRAPKPAAFHEWLRRTTTRFRPAATSGGGCLRPEAMAFPDAALEQPAAHPRQQRVRAGNTPVCGGAQELGHVRPSAGAASSCKLCTVIETAKANHWNPAKYLTKVFQRAAGMSPGDDWSPLLSWNLPK